VPVRFLEVIVVLLRSGLLLLSIVEDDDRRPKRRPIYRTFCTQSEIERVVYHLTYEPDQIKALLTMPCHLARSSPMLKSTEGTRVVVTRPAACTESHRDEHLCSRSPRLRFGEACLPKCDKRRLVRHLCVFAGGFDARRRPPSLATLRTRPAPSRGLEP
jgi:hypothetical protein